MPHRAVCNKKRARIEGTIWLAQRLSVPNVLLAELLRSAKGWSAKNILFGDSAIFEYVTLNLNSLECFVSGDIGSEHPIREKSRDLISCLHCSCDVVHKY